DCLRPSGLHRHPRRHGSGACARRGGSPSTALHFVYMQSVCGKIVLALVRPRDSRRRGSSPPGGGGALLTTGRSARRIAARGRDPAGLRSRRGTILPVSRLLLFLRATGVRAAPGTRDRRDPPSLVLPHG